MLQLRGFQVFVHPNGHINIGSGEVGFWDALSDVADYFGYEDWASYLEGLESLGQAILDRAGINQ